MPRERPKEVAKRQKQINKQTNKQKKNKEIVNEESGGGRMELGSPGHPGQFEPEEHGCREKAFSKILL